MIKRLLGAVSVIALMAAVTPAKADFVTLGGVQWSTAGVDNLTLTPVVPGGNQPLNVQCIICGENQPQQQANFGYTDFHNAGNQTSEIYFSTAVAGGANPGTDTVGLGYDGSFLRAYLLASGDPTLTFSIGVDVNDTSPQTLQSFFLLNLTTHTVLSAFTTPTLVGSQNNGTGFPDYTLGTFNITLGTDIHIGDQLIFFANLQNTNDGPDSFFIVPAAADVPEPGSLALMGSGLIGMMGVVGWKRRRDRDQLPV